MNYIGDLRKHRKQLEDVNNQLAEELAGLSKLNITTVQFFL